MTFICEMSGESVDLSSSSAGGSNEMVVTPSGHVCLKRLLLTKLSENGGVDPFHGAGEQDVPLAEENLVTLASGGSASISTIMPPRPPNVSSLPNLLGLLQKEYDTIVLELFDTRKALEETRRELSQALYQNDAAVRVIARLAMERDAAQQQLKQWNANGGVAAPAADGDENEPQAKRRRQDDPETTTTTTTLQGKIPESHLTIMIDTWKTLSKERKVKSKAAKPLTAEDLSQNLSEMEDAAQSLHKPRSKAGISVMTCHTDKTVTAGKHDKQIVCYNNKTSTVDFTIQKVPSAVTSLSLNESFLVSGSVDGKVRMYSTTQDGAFQGELDVGSSISTTGKKKHKIVHLTIHPSNQHILVTLEVGCVVLCGLSADGIMTIVSTFEPPEQEGGISYTCGALHPDGLIYGTGTNTGVVHIWDLKNQNLAGTLASDATDGNGDAIVSLAFSNNGYHIGTALSKSAKVQVWDLRKLKVVTTLNVGDENDKNNLNSVNVVAFDTSGKHLAFGGDGGIRITTSKVWGITASLAEDHYVTGILWNNNMNGSTADGDKPYTLVTCSEKERPLRFYGC